MNISHDSIVGFEEYKLEKDGDYTLKKSTINKEYDNLPNYNYANIEYDIFKGVGDEKKKIGYKVCRFAENKSGEKSILPRILMSLLKARKDTRKKMKYKTGYTKEGKTFTGLFSETELHYSFKTVEGKEHIIKKDLIVDIKQTFNSFQIAVLDGQQLAFKVTCNSLYGQVGASTSPICFKELAASTTARGRQMVCIARDETINNFKGSKLVYGDTDSVFINFVDYIKKKYSDKEKYTDYYDEKGKFKEKELLRLTIETGQEVGEYITSKLKKPQDLEYEKVFCNLLYLVKRDMLVISMNFQTRSSNRQVWELY